jgi:hypothetical protein
MPLEGEMVLGKQYNQWIFKWALNLAI